MSGRRLESNPHGLKYNREQMELYREQGFWGDATLLDCWNMTVLRHPHKTAVIDSQNKALSFRQVDSDASRLARYLYDAGVVPGDVVSFQLPGWAEFLPVIIACLKAGAVLNPIPTNLRFEETRFILSQCESKVIFAPHHYKKFNHEHMVTRLRKHLPHLRNAVAVDKLRQGSQLPTLAAILEEYEPLSQAEICRHLEGRVRADDLAAVLFTSGSEGSPKGVMLTHNNIIFSETSFAAYFNITQFDIMLMPAPVTHATGFHHGVTMPYLVGATTVLQDIFDPKMTLQLIEEYRCTVSMASAPFLHDMLLELRKRPYDLSSLRFFQCGGSPVSPAMIEEALQYGIVTCNVYGSTESVPHTGVLPQHSLEQKICSAGKPMPGIEVKVAGPDHAPLPLNQEGQEASRGPQVFMGYLKNAEMTDAAIDDAGWYYSGDLCVLDEEGFLRITGRLKDMIIRGGENISSLEVENFLARHPNVSEVAVVSMPDPRLTEKACAYVVLNEPSVGLSFDQMVEFLLTQDIAKQKFPERLEILEALPRTASGKVKKSLLRQDVREKMAREGLEFSFPEEACICS